VLENQLIFLLQLLLYLIEVEGNDTKLIRKKFEIVYYLPDHLLEDSLAFPIFSRNIKLLKLGFHFSD
jgi:hypothetical protein